MGGVARRLGQLGVGDGLARKASASMYGFDDDGPSAGSYVDGSEGSDDGDGDESDEDYAESSGDEGDGDGDYADEDDGSDDEVLAQQPSGTKKRQRQGTENKQPQPQQNPKRDSRHPAADLLDDDGDDGSEAEASPQGSSGSDEESGHDDGEGEDGEDGDGNARPKKRGKDAAAAPYDPKDYKKAQELVSKMPVDVTGARPGELLVGVHNIAGGAAMYLRGTATVKAHKGELDRLRRYPELWDRFMERIRTIDFFAAMRGGEAAIDAWLRANSVSKGVYIQEYEGAEAELMNAGTSKMSELLTPAQIDDIFEQGTMAVKDIYDMFPRKDGSKAKNTTLFFGPGYWSVVAPYTIQDRFDGILVDAVRGIAPGSPETRSVVARGASAHRAADPYRNYPGGRGRFAVGRVYGFEELPEQAQADFAAQLEDNYDSGVDDYRFRFVLVDNVQDYFNLHEKHGENLDDDMEDEYIGELVESIEREGLRSPPIGNEGNHRILAFAKMGVPMPYFEPILIDGDGDDEDVDVSAQVADAPHGGGEHVMVFDVVLNKQPHKVGVLVERTGMQMSDKTMLALAR